MTGPAAETMTVLRWEEPPPAFHVRKGRAPSSRLSPIADELRARPGQWGVVFEGPGGAGGGMVTHIRLGQVACFAPAGDFDATGRTQNGVTTVYARYVGDDE